MTMPRSDNSQKDQNLRRSKEQVVLDNMRKGYKEMAEINLSISKLYFEAESEVASYYDRISGV